MKKLRYRLMKVRNSQKSSVIIAVDIPKINYNTDEPRFLICDDCFNRSKTNLFNAYQADYDRFLF
jgi:hypothetical protein